MSHRAIRRRYPDVAELFRKMLGDPADETREAAARLLTLASYYDDALDNDVDVLSASVDDTTRAAAVGVFADNISYASRRDRSIAVISTAFTDPVTSIRVAAERAFYRLEDQPLAESAPLIAAFAASPAVADGTAAALMTLEESPANLFPRRSLTSARPSSPRTSRTSETSAPAPPATSCMSYALRCASTLSTPTPTFDGVA